MILRVAIEAPIPELFDYLPAPGLGEHVWTPGMRLLVPFGRGQRVGILFEVASSTEQDAARLKPIDAILDPHPLLGAEDLRLLRWSAAYYQHPIGEALFAALPARLRSPMPLLDDLSPGFRVTPEGAGAAPNGLGRSARQREILAALQAEVAGMTASALNARFGQCVGPLRALRQKGLVEPCRLEQPRSALFDAAGDPRGPELNSDQARVVAEVEAAFGAFRAFLLDGVTGSGKTEVYLRLIQSVIGAGGQALVMVPEIGLTPQLRERFARRLLGQIAVLHSGLNPSERERGWHLAASGEAALVLGTRSAIFAPMPRLALILVDEEHDASLKQQEGFRYSARDLAVRRAQLLGCPVVLGSATPSLETLHNARGGRYSYLSLPKRAGGAELPSIALLDIRDQPLMAGLSPVLREHMRSEIAAGNQVLLFLNRRGYAPVYTCHSCGWVSGCPHCDARMTLHLQRQRLWCHHCDWSEPLPKVCPTCKGADLRMLGQGTERLEDDLRPLFPDVGIARIDRDSTRRKGELARLFDQARRGEVRILLGTQMLAKGHDLPGVTLVGILDLDQSLHASDFRAPERTAQLIMQVAGRAGRAERPGRVVLQTRHPEHPLLQSLLKEGYGGFAETVMAERRAAELPPFAHLALVRADAPGADLALTFLREARGLADGLMDPSVLLFGPVPAPMERRAGRHRGQLLVQAADRPRLQQFLYSWIRQLRVLPRRQGLRWSVDVDPQEML